MIKRVKQEFCGWQLREVVYIISATVFLVSVSISFDSSVSGIISAVSGTLYTMLAGKGKISCYFFGIINSIIYGYIAFEQKLFGDAALNLCCYLPMMFIGIASWKSNMDQSCNVIKTGLSWKMRGVTFLLCTAAVMLCAEILKIFGDSQPYVDSITNVLSVAAMILTVKRCADQWIMWIIVNAVSVFMWTRVVIDDTSKISTLLWWIIMLITGIIFFIQWQRDIRKEN